MCVTMHHSPSHQIVISYIRKIKKKEAITQNCLTLSHYAKHYIMHVT